MRLPKWRQKIRVKLAGELGKVWPENAQMNIEYYRSLVKRKGLISLEFMVDGLPVSLNSQYDIGTKYCKPGTPGAFKDGSGRWRVRSHRLKSNATDWRVILMEAMGQDRWKWKPGGVCAVLVLFESPEWLCLDRTIRSKDADNLVKPVLDAVQAATEVPDETNWTIHCYKVQSKRTRTTICLYDLGDLVEHYY